MTMDTLISVWDYPGPLAAVDVSGMYITAAVVAGSFSFIHYIYS